MYFPLFVGVLCLSLFGMHNFVSIIVRNHFEEEERAGCFAFVVLRMSVALPYGAVGVIVVFSDHTYLLFFIQLQTF